MNLPQGTRVPLLDTLIPCEFSADFADGRESITGKCDVPVRITHPTDIFDEMTRRGCKLNLLTFGYYMEEK